TYRVNGRARVSVELGVHQDARRLGYHHRPLEIGLELRSCENSGSQVTPRWRRQSRANPSLKPEFPASWENTGNSVRLGLRVRLLVRNRAAESITYDAIPYASEQGIYLGL